MKARLPSGVCGLAVVAVFLALGSVNARAQSPTDFAALAGDRLAGDEPAAAWAPVARWDASALSAPEFDPPPKAAMTAREVAWESSFGAASEDDWQPLSLATFFTEGWDRPYANAPKGSNLAPRGNWIGAPAGVFGRFATLDFFYTNHMNPVPALFLTANAPYIPVHTATTGNQFAGYTTVRFPLSARFEVQLAAVFVDSRKSSPTGGYVANIGDLGFQARFHMIDRPNFSVVSFFGERIPTGKPVNGSGINFVTPGLEFWWNFAPHWVARGGTLFNISTGRQSATNVYANRLSVGRYLTDETAAFFKTLEVHVTASVLSDVAGRKGYITDVYIFPGFKFSLDKDGKWAVLGGAQTPLAGPQPYAWQPQFSLTRKW